MAQDFDQLMSQQARSASPVGFKLRIPFGGAGEHKQSMRLNFGYSLKDSSGKVSFVPVTGYDPAVGGFHFLGVASDNSSSGRNDKMIAYGLFAAVAAGVAFMAFSGKDEAEPCAPGYYIDALTGLCTR